MNQNNKDNAEIDKLIALYARAVNKDANDVSLSEIRAEASSILASLKVKHHCVSNSDGLPVNFGDHYGDGFTVYKIKNDYRYHTLHCSKLAGSQRAKMIPIHIFKADGSLAPCETCCPNREAASWMKEMQLMYQVVQLIDSYTQSNGTRIQPSSSDLAFQALHATGKANSSKPSEKKSGNPIAEDPLRELYKPYDRNEPSNSSQGISNHPFVAMLLIFLFIISFVGLINLFGLLIELAS